MHNPELDDDSGVRAALRDALTEVQPPVHTELTGVLAEVLAAGQRRVRTQRLLAALGVVTVVAGVAIAATALRLGSTAAGQVAAAGPSLTSVLPDNSPSVSASPAPLPGWHTVRVAIQPGVSVGQRPSAPGTVILAPERYCFLPGDKVQSPANGKIPPEDLAQKNLLGALASAAPGAKSTLLSHAWTEVPGMGQLELDLGQPLPGGQQVQHGTLSFSTVAEQGSAVDNADAIAVMLARCAPPPQRKNLPNGVVLQLNVAIVDSGGKTSQTGYVFTPDHYMYGVTLTGQQGQLPLTQDQLVGVLAALATAPAPH